MADYILSCCSTVDTSVEWCNERDISYIYFNYQLDGVALKDDFGKTNPPDQLYAKMLAGADAKTSQVAVGEYIVYFREFLEAGKDILHLSLDSGISGTVESARMAQEQLAPEFPDRTIAIVDSMTATAGYALLMDELARQRSAGVGFSELCEQANMLRAQVHLWFESSDLTFFIRGGRISKASGILGGMLNICPIMDIEPDGTLAVKAKVRTKRKALAFLVDTMEKECIGGRDYARKVCVAHSECKSDAEALAIMLKERFPKLDGEVPIFSVGATIGTHTGPGTTIIGFWGTPRF